MTISGNLTYNRYRVRRNTTEPGFSFEARNDQVSQTLLIPGLDRLNPNKLFAQGQPGGWADPYDLTRMWVDDAGTTPATIASLGTGIGRVVTKGNAITLTQANAADRPVWGRHPVSGINNLLTNSEVPNGTASLALSQNVTTGGVGSFGSLGSVNSIAFGDNAALRFAYLNFTPVSGTSYTTSVFVRMDDLSAPVVGTTTTSGDFGLVGFSNLVTSGVTVTHVGDNIYRVSGTRSEASTSANWGVIKYTGQSAKTFRVTGFQVNIGTTATPYQRVTNRFDITEVGSPSLYYFSTNGVNQGWVSNANVDFSGTNKVTIWAGVAKLSDAAFAALVELSADSNVNNGTFLLAYPRSSLESGANMVMKGTGTLQSTLTTGPFPAPRTSAICGTASISQPLVAIRENGTLLFSNSTTTGTGNFSSNLLYLFRRGGVSGPFNGRIYSLIIAGDNYDTRTIQRFSDWTLKPRRLITA